MWKQGGAPAGEARCSRWHIPLHGQENLCAGTDHGPSGKQTKGCIPSGPPGGAVPAAALEIRNMDKSAYFHTISISDRRHAHKPVFPIWQNAVAGGESGAKTVGSGQRNTFFFEQTAGFVSIQANDYHLLMTAKTRCAIVLIMRKGKIRRIFAESPVFPRREWRNRQGLTAGSLAGCGGTLLHNAVEEKRRN